jgi:hypothetical protein
MAKLILSIEGAVLKEIPIVKGRTTIGRKPQNDIQIDNLAISGEHAVLVMMDDAVILEDLNSTNGTFVNGRPVSRYPLQDGDVIALGKYKMKYIAEPLHQPNPADFEKTMILRPGAAAAAEAAMAHEFSASKTDIGNMSAYAASANSMRPAAAGRASVAAPVGVIQIISGGNAGKSLELTKTLTTLGKPGVQVAVITRRPHGYFITHVEGKDFPIVDGESIGAQAHKLVDHSIIDLAGIKMEFFLKE